MGEEEGLGVIHRVSSLWGRKAAAAAASGPAARWTRRSARCAPALQHTGDRTGDAGEVRRHDHGALLVGFRQLAERLDVLLGHEVVQRVDAAPFDGVGHHLGRLRLGAGGAFARLGVAERGLAAALGLEDGGLLGAFRAGDGRLLLALGLGDHRPPLALGLHLPGHGVGDVGRRLQVLDLDPRHLDAPGAGRLVDHGQQAGIDVLAVGQHLVQLHRADHGAQIGHGKLGDRAREVGDAVGGRRGVHHLDEDDGVDLHADVVLGDHLLLRHRQHLLHHADAPAHRLHERGQDGEAGLEGARVAAEALHRVFEALRHGLDRRKRDHQGQRQQNHYDDAKHQDLPNICGSLSFRGGRRHGALREGGVAA